MIDSALLGASHAAHLMANQSGHAPLTDNPISCLKTRNVEGAAINGVIVKYETSPKQILEQWPTDRHMRVGDVLKQKGFNALLAISVCPFFLCSLSVSRFRRDIQHPNTRILPTHRTGHTHTI